MNTDRIVQFVVVDDDSVDRELFAAALDTTGQKFKLTEASGGEALFQLLESSSSMPDLIFLDLNMPGKDGRETLRELKADNRYQHIPVFILSTSSASFDVDLCYANGAALFFSKPHDFKLLVDMLRNVLTLGAKYISFPGRH